jgi:hypothetical protein
MQFKKGMRLYAVEWIDFDDHVYPLPKVRPYLVTGVGQKLITIAKLGLGRLKDLPGRRERYSLEVAAGRFQATPRDAIQRACRRANQKQDSAQRAIQNAERELKDLESLGLTLITDEGWKEKEAAKRNAERFSKISEFSEELLRGKK